MCYGQVNGDAIQNFLSFFPFSFLTPFPFLGTTSLSSYDLLTPIYLMNDDDRSLESRWSSPF